MAKNVINTLEFDKIITQLTSLMHFDLSRELAKNIAPSKTATSVQNLLNETFEAYVISKEIGGLDVPDLPSIQEEIKRLEIQAPLSLTEITNIYQHINVVQKLKDNFLLAQDDEQVANQTKLVLFRELFKSFFDLAEVKDRLDQILSEDGILLDDASENLHKIRLRKRNVEQKTQKIIRDLLKSISKEYLSESFITTRDGREVIPIKASYRNQVKGTVRDTSQSGQTLYIEPERNKQLNDELNEIQSEEKIEIGKILASISLELSKNSNSIKTNDFLLARLDFANGKAALAIKMNANMPQVNEKKTIHLVNAWHPLIDEGNAVKNDFSLGDKFQILVITGPNTGGKTITIKTFGILQLMAQSGLFITADSNSEVTIFDDFFADIGDEQSIEENLSTFSSHIVNIIDILKKANSNSLVILDELGSGTDPHEGATLAISIIETLQSKNISAIISTHYPEIKVFSENTKGIMNASMAFNSETLSPTYKFLIGIPGQSNALNIAEKLGMNSEVIKTARSLVDPNNQKINLLIENLVNQKITLENNNRQLDKKINEVNKKEADLNEKLSEIDFKKNAELLNAQKEANQIVDNASLEAERLISEIRKTRLSQRNSEENGLNEQELQKKKSAINNLRKDTSLLSNKVLKRAKKKATLTIGDEVQIISLRQNGILLRKINNTDWEVQIGILKLTVNELDLSKIKEKTQILKHESSSVRTSIRSNTAVTTKIDLRGKRFDEVSIELDKFIDDALLARIDTIEIIHGRGTGAIKKAVNEFLRTDRRVLSFHFANANAGGDGATIANLG